MAEYRGSGGAIFEITVPEPGTHARENFDAQVASGALVEVKPKPKPTAGVTKPKPREE